MTAVNLPLERMAGVRDLQRAHVILHGIWRLTVRKISHEQGTDDGNELSANRMRE